jgi:hypothetical protein
MASTSAPLSSPAEIRASATSLDLLPVLINEAMGASPRDGNVVAPSRVECEPLEQGVGIAHVALARGLGDATQKDLCFSAGEALDEPGRHVAHAIG